MIILLGGGGKINDLAWNSRIVYVNEWAIDCVQFVACIGEMAFDEPKQNHSNE